MVDLVEVLIDDNPGETWMRFRFIAPQIARLGGDVAYEVAAADLDHLCRTVALPYLAAQGVDVARVVISLSDRPVVFGDSDPDATQFFETYRPDEDRCVWEEY